MAGLVPQPFDAFTPEDLDLLAKSRSATSMRLQEQRGEAGVAERERERERLAELLGGAEALFGRVAAAS